MRPLNYLPLIRFFILLLFFAVLFLLYHYLLRYIYPFIIALLITLILHPIISYFENSYNMNRRLASYLSVFLIFSTISLLTFILLQRMVKELAQLTEHLPDTFNLMNDLFIHFGQTTLLPIYDALQAKLFFLPKGAELDIEKTIPFITDKIYDSSHTIITNTFFSLSSIITSVSQAGIVIIIILISVMMMTKDFTLMKQTYQNMISPRISRKGSDILFHFKKSTLGLVKAQFVLALLSSCIALIAFLIFPVKNVLVLTMTIFLVDLIPYIGIGVIFIPWIAFQFLNGDYIFTIQLISLYMLLIMIRQFIEPKIIATHLQIHPLIALMILFASIQYFGITGIILTPLILVTLSAMHHANVLSYMYQYIFEKK